jgi:hypothetical protein
LILDRAFELKRVMFSQDQDFLIEANHRQAKGILLQVLFMLVSLLLLEIASVT